MKLSEYLKPEPLETRGASISRFMNWAAERIAKEVEENERVELETGTREFIPGSGKTKRQDYTEQEKINVVTAVNELKSKGYGVAVSCKKVGIHGSTYRKWKKKYKL